MVFLIMKLGVFVGLVVTVASSCVCDSETNYSLLLQQQNNQVRALTDSLIRMEKIIKKQRQSIDFLMETVLKFVPTPSPLSSPSASASALPSPSPIVCDISTFGMNNYGAIGDGTLSWAYSPQSVSLGTGTRGVTEGAVATGLYHTSVFSLGTIYEWGMTSTAQWLSPTRISDAGFQVVSMCAGDRYTIAISDSGSVYAWGLNSKGQLGLGDFEARPSPTQLSSSSFGGDRIDKVACGNEFTSFLSTANKRLWTSGHGLDGQLGTGFTGDVHTPVLLPVSSLLDSVNGEHVTDVAHGASHALIRTSSGRVFGWGFNAFGQVGDGSFDSRMTPVQLLFPTAISKIATGSHHSLALGSDGAVYSWGFNDNGQLCAPSGQHQPIPTKVTTTGSMTQGVIDAMDAGYFVSLFVSNGNLYGCGMLQYLGLGTASTDAVATPTLINSGALANKTVRFVNIFYWHALVLLEQD